MIRTTWLETLLVALTACEVTAETPEELQTVRGIMATVQKHINEVEKGEEHERA